MVNLPHYIRPTADDDYSFHEDADSEIAMREKYKDLWRYRCEALQDERGFKISWPKDATIKGFQQAHDFAVQLDTSNYFGYCPVCSSKDLSTYYFKKTIIHLETLCNPKDDRHLFCLGHVIIRKYFMLSTCLFLSKIHLKYF